MTETHTMTTFFSLEVSPCFWMKGENEEETSKRFTLFAEKTGRTAAALFQGVSMNDILIVINLVQVNIFLYDRDFKDGGITGALARRNVGKLSNIFRLIPFNSDLCYIFDTKKLFKAYRCPSCDTFFNRTPKLERHLTTCTDIVTHVYLKNVFRLRETLFDKLDLVGIVCLNNQKLFNNMAVFEFQSICVEDETLRLIETTTWIGKHISISVSVSILIRETHLPLRSFSS